MRAFECCTAANFCITLAFLMKGLRPADFESHQPDHLYDIQLLTEQGV